MVLCILCTSNIYIYIIYYACTRPNFAASSSTSCRPFNRRCRVVYIAARDWVHWLLGRCFLWKPERGASVALVRMPAEPQNRFFIRVYVQTYFLLPLLLFQLLVWHWHFMHFVSLRRRSLRLSLTLFGAQSRATPTMTLATAAIAVSRISTTRHPLY